MRITEKGDRKTVKLGIEVKNKEAKIRLEKLEKKAGDLRPFFVNFWAYMQSRTQLMFIRNRKGGTFRGVNWPWFAGQYNRSGGKVPAEGGVPKLRGSGMVKGRLRGKGKRDVDRIKPTSNLLRHRGIMYNAALGRIKKRPRVLVMDTNVNYAGYQDSMRPFQFFELPKDQNVAVRMFHKYLKADS